MPNTAFLQKNILILTHSFEEIGGSITLANNISDILSSNNNVYKVSLNYSVSKQSDKSNISYFTLGTAPPKYVMRFKILNRLIMAARLKRLKKKLCIDLSVSVLWEADFVSLLSGGSDLKIALAVTNYYNNPTNQAMVNFNVLFGFIYRRFDKILAINNAVKSEIVKLFLIRKEQLGVFRNFLPQITPKPVWPGRQNNRFIFCGRFVDEKNLEGLLLVWKQFSQMPGQNGHQLIVIGDGPLKTYYYKFVDELNLSVGFHVDDAESDVVFLGFVERPEDYLAGARALLVPSRNEGTPTVIIMALMLGVPVIAADSNSGCIRETLVRESYSNKIESFYTTSGLLMPVPEKTSKISISTWVDQLAAFVADENTYAKLQIGALQLGRSYSVDRAKKEWEGIIKDMFAK